MPALTISPGDRRGTPGSRRGWQVTRGRLLAILVLIVLILSPWSTAVSLAGSPVIDNEIAAANDQFMKAFAARDAAGVAALYTTDAAILPPNLDILRGRAAIEAFWQGAMNMGVAKVTLESIEVERLGNTATEVGQYQLAGAADQVLDAGKYIVIWKNVGGKWMLFRDIWNTSKPVPTS